MPKADCGLVYDHGGHAYLTPRGKVKACDGSTTKRPSPASSAPPATESGQA